MNLVGVMLVRNESWVLRASLKAALQWCDKLVVMDHASTDDTPDVIKSFATLYPGRVYPAIWPDGSVWDEMSARQETLTKARQVNASHVAIVDADEIITANLLPKIRRFIEPLKPAQLLDVAMVPVWGDLFHYRNDASVWCHSWISLAFADHPDLSWKPDQGGYHHHHRMPYGAVDIIRAGSHGNEGVMHLQFANKRRLVAKHILYRMIDHLRWPGRESSEALNAKYDRALDESSIRLSACPSSWWNGHDVESVKLDGVPWQESEVARLIDTHGRKRFNGLDLKGR